MDFNVELWLKALDSSTRPNTLLLQQGGFGHRPTLVGLYVVFPFCSFVLVFFLVYLSFIAYLYVYGNSLIVGYFICILAMMSEMYQVHQFVFLNLSLPLNLKTIYSTQVQNSIFR